MLQCSVCNRAYFKHIFLSLLMLMQNQPTPPPKKGFYSCDKLTKKCFDSLCKCAVICYHFILFSSFAFIKRDFAVNSEWNEFRVIIRDERWDTLGIHAGRRGSGWIGWMERAQIGFGLGRHPNHYSTRHQIGFTRGQIHTEYSFGP